MKRLKSPLVEF